VLDGHGGAALAAVPLSAVSMAAFLGALHLTAVANVFVVYGTLPLIAAGLALLWLGERVGRRAVIASAIALVGIVIMAGRATRPTDLAGNALALLMTVTFAAVLVLVRRHPTLPMAPVNALAALLCAALSWPLMPPGVPAIGELLLLAAFGLCTMSLAYLLFLTGGRHIPSGEAGLIGLLEVVLGPLWVWLAVGEDPGGAAILGGAIVLGAVLWLMLGGARADRA
jgi:drug/metabolite transporter (DMT)-like permease